EPSTIVIEDKTNHLFHHVWVNGNLKRVIGEI
ncbi:unnamed protein product, partial [marine sediment metagenome]